MNFKTDRHELSSLSMVQFPPHGSRIERRVRRRSNSGMIALVFAGLSVVSLFAVYTGMARGVVGLAALIAALVFGLWMVTFHD